MMTMQSGLQQLGGLLFTIFTTFAFSLLLSIPLLFRQAIALSLRCFKAAPQRTLSRRSSAGGRAGKMGAISYFEGSVWHERRSPHAHKFSYSVRYALVNLDYAPSFFVSAAARHHMTSSKARAIAGTSGPVYLLTVPTSVGYEQNPLSVYYCFNEDETRLLVCIAEVTNTPWGERVTFLFDPNGDAVAKPLHVSPFMSMSGTWHIKTCVPDHSITIRIDVEHPEHGSFFTASLCATRVDCCEPNSEGFFWLMPHKTAIGIYWQAFLLWWKGVGFYGHPKYVDGNAYRHLATLKDNEMLSKQKEMHWSRAEDVSCSHMLKTSNLGCTRSFEWYEACWPWT